MIAEFHDRAAFALWFARAAYGAAQTDQVDVEGIEFPPRDDAGKNLVSGLVAALLRNQTHAPKNAKDVHVEREDLVMTGKEQCTGGGLGANTPETGEVSSSFRRVHLVQKIQVEGAAFCL